MLSREPTTCAAYDTRRSATAGRAFWFARREAYWMRLHVSSYGKVVSPVIVTGEQRDGQATALRASSLLRKTVAADAHVVSTTPPTGT